MAKMTKKQAKIEFEKVWAKIRALYNKHGIEATLRSLDKTQRKLFAR